MTECMNEDFRDLLPLLAHGSLPAGEAARVRAHVAACAECTAELSSLESIRQVLSARVPQVDVAAIALAVFAATSRGTPLLRVVPGDASTATPAATVAAPRRGWVPRHYVAAAASILVVVSLSIPLLRPDPTAAPEPVASVPSSISPIDTPEFATPGTSPAAAVAEGLVVADGLADLSDDDLESLLKELETLEATVSAEPGTLRRPLMNTPGGL